MVENRAQPVRLGRGFWMVTALLAVLGAAGIVFWYVFPIEQYLPAAIVTARQVDTLFRFMAATGTALYVFVCGYLVYFAIAFRVRPSDPPDAIGVQIHDNPKLEFWWAVDPGAVRHPALGRFGAHLVRDHARARKRARRSGDRPSVRFHVPIPADQRRDLRRNASAGQRAGHAQSHVVRRHSLVLGAGDAPQERYRARARHVDSLHSAPDRTVSNHLHAVLRRASQPNEQTSAGHRRPRHVQHAGTTRCKSRTRTSATRCRRRAARRSRWRAARHRPVRRSSSRSARPVTRSVRSISASSDRGSKACCTTRRIPISSTAIRPLPTTSPKYCKAGIPAASARCPTPRPTDLSNQDIANLVAYLETLK